MRVLSIDDVGFLHRGGSIFMAYLRAKERLIDKAPGSSLSNLGMEASITDPLKQLESILAGASAVPRFAANSRYHDTPVATLDLGDERAIPVPASPVRPATRPLRFYARTRRRPGRSARPPGERVLR